MTNKLYDKLKKLIKENLLFIIIYISIILIFFIRLPYFISVPGGIININDRVEVISSNNIEGTFNYAYVSEARATIPMLIVSLFNKKWDVESINESKLSEEDLNEIDYRNKLYLKESINNAIIVAYNKLNKEVIVKENKIIVVGDVNSNFKIKDEIIKVNDITVKNLEQLKEIIANSNIGEKLDFEVKSDNKIEKRSAIVYEDNNRKIIGVLFTEEKTLITDPKINIITKETESGSSGGLMLALTIYNKLLDYDLTKGLNIVGTGSIDEYGNVSKIGGIKYKLLGASKENVDLFIVPYENYEEAIKINEEYDLGYKIIFVKTFDEALNYLENI